MQSYFFDVHDGIEVVDHAGQKLPGLDAVREHAAQVAADYAAYASAAGSDSGAIIVTVRADEDRVLLTLRLAFDIEMPRAG